jgi:hypothetical protein
MQTHVFQQNWEKNLQEKRIQMKKWAKKSEEAPTKVIEKKEIDLNQKINSSNVELSSFLDVSELMKSEYEMLHPKKYDSKAIQNFKKTMLETAIKPMSWRDHRNRINKTQEIFAERQRLKESQDIRNESKGGSLMVTRDVSMNSNQDAPKSYPAPGSATQTVKPEVQDMDSFGKELTALNRIIPTPSYRPVKKETKAYVDTAINRIE